MSIRPRTDADLPACVDILTAVHQNGRYPTRWPVDPAAWLSPSYLSAAWVAEDAAQLAGKPAQLVGHLGIAHGVEVAALQAATGKTPDELASITRLFVHPAARRGGHAQALLQTATDHAAALHLQLVLDVVETGTAAIALYERLGWRFVTSEPAAWVNAAGEHPIVRYYVGP